GDCCSCAALKAVRKVRIGPEHVDEFKIEYFVPEYPVVDDLLNRAMRGMDASDIAAPEPTREVADVLRALEVTPPDASIGMVDSPRTAGAGSGTVFMFSTDDAEFAFRMVHQDGRLFITELLRPRPRAAAFLGAVRVKLAALGTYPSDFATLPSAAEQVAHER